MTTINIPLPDFRVEYRFDYTYEPEDTEHDVTFMLVFAEFTIVEKTYSVPRRDYDDTHFNERREEFDEYIAERMSRLFT